MTYDFVVSRDNGVNGVVLVSVTLDDRLNDVVNVVVLALVNVLSLVNDDAVLLCLLVVVLVLANETGEDALVLVSVDVLLFDVGCRDDVFVVNLAGVLRVTHGLRVVLHVVDVAVDLALPLNLLGLVNLVTLLCRAAESDRVSLRIVLTVRPTKNNVRVTAARCLWSCSARDAASRSR